MTCKDCIHNGVCWKQQELLDMHEWDEEQECCEDNSRYIELPCKVGDTVWCIYNYIKPKEFQITIFTMSENHYSFVIETKNGVYKHYCDKDSVGKWVFFSREEAEKALAEGSEDES